MEEFLEFGRFMRECEKTQKRGSWLPPAPFADVHGSEPFERSRFLTFESQSKKLNRPVFLLLAI